LAPAHKVKAVDIFGQNLDRAATYTKTIRSGRNQVREGISMVSKGLIFERKSGGAERDRTVDLLNAIQALSQLSYSPKTR
jgi:hypothetical protein